MNRISLTDNSGRWFDIETAKRWDEAVILADDGTPISRATGNSWEHEVLFLTKNGTFLLFSGSDRNPSLSTFDIIEPEKAVHWLLSNNHHDGIDQLEYSAEVKKFEL